ncbi:hypothetical protein SAMN05421684_3025 [Asanoa ishikariensis]|uniref:Phage derived protein Gp49-like n=1 Tax=Asanoa ishikariensis TaxID=137265 RepID=A0A1H3QNW5_9ACTN|nr:type II toxin-antitoxin system RelE/ParE family toxin [Asanoa ishikariensis]SDZ14781.1 hypothetical protein SAMN05421684_3025 [Asanoa ishikariensis]
MGWTVYVHPDAEDELLRLPAKEERSMLLAIDKLKAMGRALPHPHRSDVRGTDEPLRELRPRRGASPWRAFYRDYDAHSVVGSIGPEAAKDKRGFDQAVDAAVKRLATIEDS